MDAIKTWVLAGVLGAALSILAYVIASIANRSLNRLDAILAELQDLNKTLSKHEAQIEAIHDRLGMHEGRLSRLESK